MHWKYINRRAAGFGDGPILWNTGESADDPKAKFGPTFQGFNPTLDLAHAMMVLEKCLEKMSCNDDDDDTIMLAKLKINWTACSNTIGSVQAKTLPKTIVLFARELWK